MNRPPHHQPRLLALVLVGGTVGALLRYAVALLLPVPHDGFPTATFLTNLSGSFALGLLLSRQLATGAQDGRPREVGLLLGTGLLGAFTTYSTLAVEVVLLGRDGRVGLGLVYGVASAVLGLGAAGLGAVLGARTGATRS